jgi:Tol biopolymer transport system component
VDAAFSLSDTTPEVTGVVPPSGPTTGGTEVVLLGTNLEQTTRVTIGGVEATIVGEPTSTSVTILTPAGVAGVKEVVVTGSQGPVTTPRQFVYNASAKITDESAPANAPSTQPSLNRDGRFVAFRSLGDNLVAGDTNEVADIFVRDRSTRAIHRVSVATDGAQANGESAHPKISADGRYVAFVSSASNLVVGDTNGVADIFLHDRDVDGDGIFDEVNARATIRVSVASDGQQANGASAEPDLSPDGLWVAFSSLATNLVVGDTNGVADVFAHNWPSGQTRRISVTSTGAQANGASRAPDASLGARRIVFASDATNLVEGDGNGARDVFLHERGDGSTIRVSTKAGTTADADGASDHPSIDFSGNVVAFQTTATDITFGAAVPAGVNQVVVMVLAPVSGQARAGVAAASVRVGAPVVSIADALRNLISTNAAGQAGSGDSTSPSISGSGTAVAFESEAGDLVLGDGNDDSDVFLSAVSPSTAEVSPPQRASLDSAGNEADGPSRAPAVSGDGRMVSFESDARLTPASSSHTNVFVRGERLLVARLSPPSRPADTGQTIVIEGAGFAPGVTVRFGSLLSPKVVVLNSSRLEVEVPYSATATVVDLIVTNVDGERVTLPGAFTYTAPPSANSADADHDGLSDDWENQFGLDAESATSADGADGDPDADGVSNRDELAAGTHPRGTFARFLAEGASSSLFRTRIALANPSPSRPAIGLLRFQKPDGSQVSTTVTVPPMESRRVNVGDIPGMGAAEFATVVESDGLLVVDRQMSWDAANGYGSHAEAAVRSPGLTWYFAEGATHSGFELFYLLQNPSATSDAVVRARYLLPSGGPIEKTYVVKARSRFNIWADNEQFPEGSGNLALANTDVSVVFEVTNGVPVIAERSMYLNRPGQMFAAGHESAGVPAPALNWFLAEGATGEFFDEFVLLANPNAAAAEAQVAYLLEDGTVYTRSITVPGNSRQNIWVDFETPDATTGFPLAQAALSTKVEVTNGVPIVVERAMWWTGSGGTWYEAHTSAGSTVTGTLWVLADGEVGGAPANAATYVLVANTSDRPADLSVTLLFDGGPAVIRNLSVAPNSRRTLDIGFEFPESVGRTFGVIVESLGATPAPITVERAMYGDALGVKWAAGSNQLATRLR